MTKSISRRKSLIDEAAARELGQATWRRFGGTIGTCPFERNSRLARAWWAGFHGDRARPPPEEDHAGQMARLFQVPESHAECD